MAMLVHSLRPSENLVHTWSALTHTQPEADGLHSPLVRRRCSERYDQTEHGTKHGEHCTRHGKLVGGHLGHKGDHCTMPLVTHLIDRRRSAELTCADQAEEEDLGPYVVDDCGLELFVERSALEERVRCDHGCGGGVLRGGYSS